MGSGVVFRDEQIENPMYRGTTIRERHDQAIDQQIRNRGYGFCGCCGQPWCNVDGVTVTYSRRLEAANDFGSGLFAICKLCWDELDHWVLRAPFYLALAIKYGENHEERVKHMENLLANLKTMWHNEQSGGKTRIW